MYIFFDTETNGLPKDYKAPSTDTDNWPQLLQVAWQVYDHEEKLLIEESYLIKISDEFEMNEKAMSIHGFTKQECQNYGIEIDDALERFIGACGKASKIIAHNIAFDQKIIGAEIVRQEMEEEFENVKYSEMICTMEGSTEHCKLKGPYGPKWPKLQELHENLFDEGFDGAHNALIDVKATARCFFELKKRGII